MFSLNTTTWKSPNTAAWYKHFSLHEMTITIKDDHNCWVAKFQQQQRMANLQNYRSGLLSCQTTKEEVIRHTTVISVLTFKMPSFECNDFDNHLQSVFKLLLCPSFFFENMVVKTQQRCWTTACYCQCDALTLTFPLAPLSLHSPSSYSRSLAHYLTCEIVGQVKPFPPLLTWLICVSHSVDSTSTLNEPVNTMVTSLITWWLSAHALIAFTDSSKQTEWLSCW